MLVPEPLDHEPYFAISQYIFFSFSSMISPWQRRGAQAQTSPMAWPWIMWVSILESVSCRLSGVTSADDAWTRSGGLWSAATAAGVRRPPSTCPNPSTTRSLSLSPLITKGLPSGDGRWMLNGIRWLGRGWRLCSSITRPYALSAEVEPRRCAQALSAALRVSCPSRFSSQPAFPMAEIRGYMSSCRGGCA